MASIWGELVNAPLLVPSPDMPALDSFLLLVKFLKAKTCLGLLVLLAVALRSEFRQIYGLPYCNVHCVARPGKHAMLGQNPPHPAVVEWQHHWFPADVKYGCTQWWLVWKRQLGEVVGGTSYIESLALCNTCDDDAACQFREGSVDPTLCIGIFALVSAAPCCSKHSRTDLGRTDHKPTFSPTFQSIGHTFFISKGTSKRSPRMLPTLDTQKELDALQRPTWGCA